MTISIGAIDCVILIVYIYRMNLREYIKKLPRAERPKAIKKIALKLGLSEVYVYSMSNGNRRILEKWAVPLELATNGEIKRQDVCPHLYN